MASPNECGYCSHERQGHDIGKPARCYVRGCDCFAFELATEPAVRRKATIELSNTLHCNDSRCKHQYGDHEALIVGRPCKVETCQCDHFRVGAQFGLTDPDATNMASHNAVGDTEQIVRDLLLSIGLDPNTEGLSETPRRVAGYLREFTQPVDLTSLLKDGFDDPTDASGAMVVQDNIPFRGCCEHHLLPFHGTAAIGYIPKGRIVGLSKLTRLVQGAGTRKPSTQEEISNTIAEVLDDQLQPVGVIVVTSAIHTCMAVRGVNAPNVVTKVSAIRGVYRDVPSARAEFFAVLGR